MEQQPRQPRGLPKWIPRLAHIADRLAILPGEEKISGLLPLAQLGHKQPAFLGQVHYAVGTPVQQQMNVSAELSPEQKVNDIGGNAGTAYRTAPVGREAATQLIPASPTFQAPRRTNQRRFTREAS